MIAVQRIDPQPESDPDRQRRRRPHATEWTRAVATRRRFARAQRRGYAAFARVAAIGAVFVLPLMLYVMLTANLTGLNYTLARVQAQKTALLAQTMRQDDRIAKLESRERLAALAVQLKMHDPQTYAVVSVPPAQTAPAPRAGGVALLGAVGQWLNSAVSGSPR